MATKYAKTFEFLIDDEIQTIEANSFKKACKSVYMGKEKKEFAVRYTNKAGNLIETMVLLPMGRKKKLGR
jgi:hypothetical protein